MQQRRVQGRHQGLRRRQHLHQGRLRARDRQVRSCARSEARQRGLHRRRQVRPGRAVFQGRLHHQDQEEVRRRQPMFVRRLRPENRRVHRARGGGDRYLRRRQPVHRGRQVRQVRQLPRRQTRVLLQDPQGLQGQGRRRPVQRLDLLRSEDEELRARHRQDRQVLTVHRSLLPAVLRPQRRLLQVQARQEPHTLRRRQPLHRGGHLRRRRQVQIGHRRLCVRQDRRLCGPKRRRPLQRHALLRQDIQAVQVRGGPVDDREMPQLQRHAVHQAQVQQSHGPVPDDRRGQRTGLRRRQPMHGR